MNIPESFITALRIVHQFCVTHTIPFQVTGGFAARLYGTNRPLYDIDIEVEPADMSRVRDGLKHYVTKDIYQLQDEQFRITMMTLDIYGVPVDISQTSPIELHGKDGIWHRHDVQLSTAVAIKVDDMTVPVVDRQELLAYKNVLQRPTDLDDILQLQSVKKF